MMCLDSGAIEQQVKGFFIEIQENSIYKPIKLILADGTSILVQNNPEFEFLTSTVLIDKIILSDDNGKLYSIKSNLNGLRFAKGEINYYEYLWYCKREIGIVIIILLVSFLVLISLGWILVKYLV
ncbi:hypothetical protein SAMN05216353_1129 [Halobacillus alkaliphilus]|uniref:Uncharacterized protein n=1 Tax=Halobacillus alkaliphilus TaxID=396056 RepID=A0A1I2MEK7_9BACI|nr:hypothetical protein [Halobacillus alkaliphilus]SFF87977.1 hypothetical protein SAMN05216353_1129 [Halobacillus alkaliphilus]